MTFLYEPKVYVVGVMQFIAPPEEAAPGWDPELNLPGGEQLIEFGGRGCYRSWKNPAGRTNEEYIGNILDKVHFSVVEHAVLSIWITAISRSCSHELVRHRHLSPSQESQRYVELCDVNFVMPPAMVGRPMLETRFRETCTRLLADYREQLIELEEIYASIEDKTLRHKMCREAARAVLPNAAETRALMTGNSRSWREFIEKRANIHTDAEMCRLAVAIFQLLKQHLPSVFQDMRESVATVHGLKRRIVVSG